MEQYASVFIAYEHDTGATCFSFCPIAYPPLLIVYTNIKENATKNSCKTEEA